MPLDAIPGGARIPDAIAARLAAATKLARELRTATQAIRAEAMAFAQGPIVHSPLFDDALAAFQAAIRADGAAEDAVEALAETEAVAGYLARVGRAVA